MAIKFRTYQSEIIAKATDILYKNKLLYLAMEVKPLRL